MSTFSFLTGVLTGAVVLLAAQGLWRKFLAGQQISLPPLALAGGGLAATFVVAVGVMYLTIAHPHLDSAPTQGAATQGAATQAAAPHAVSAGDKASQAQSMESATAGLAARLSSGGGSDQDWELLAKSYDFMGKTAEAALARQHKVSQAALAAAAAAPAASPAPGSPAAPSMRDALQAVAEADTSGSQGQPAPSGGQADMTAMRAKLEQKLKSTPGDVDTLLDLAALDQSEQQYTKARERYQHVIALKRMTADSWADYADVLAAIAGGSLSGEPAKAIDQALALEPKNEKALWLKASQAYQERRYADSLALWKTLRTALPAGSPDISAVDSNIAEAQQLANGGAPAPVAAAPAAPAAAQPAVAAVAINGTVSIDHRLASKADHDATLFIFARPAGEAGGPPLAVMRVAAGAAWPVSFRLDDTLAMIPTRRLSQFDKVIVEARLSRSGQASPSPGDLYVKSEVIRPAEGKKLSLVINQKIS